MIVFDADILSEVLKGKNFYVDRLKAIPERERAITVVVFKELIEGRILYIEHVETRPRKLSIASAFMLLQQTAVFLRIFPLIPFTEEADRLVTEWKRTKNRVRVSDMRIAASCIVADATLISRNRRDFDLIPGLRVEYWNDITSNECKNP